MELAPSRIESEISGPDRDVTVTAGKFFEGGEAVEVFSCSTSTWSIESLLGDSRSVGQLRGLR